MYDINEKQTDEEKVVSKRASRFEEMDFFELDEIEFDEDFECICGMCNKEEDEEGK